MKLFTNWFSPFARKVALTLEYKGLAYEAVDGLAVARHDELLAVNSRGEVPVLLDNDVTIAQSSHIIDYLEDAYPERTVFPANARARATARKLQYIFDTRVDAILVDCSLWSWSDRSDKPPLGMMDVAQSDLNAVFDIVEQQLKQSSTTFIMGETPSVADFSLWPHIAAVRPLGFQIDDQSFPALCGWLAHLKTVPLFRSDAKRTAEFIDTMTSNSHEKTKIAWRGDRIEWVLSRGFHDWFFQEVSERRVIWPLQHN